MSVRRLTFLIDTNVFLTLEPFGALPANEPFEDAARFARRVHEHGHRLAIHEATRDDLLRDGDQARLVHNMRCLEKYLVLRDVPVSAAVSVAFPGESANDRIDSLIVSALDVNAADHLVTQDRRLRQRVERGAPALAERVFSLAEATEFLEQLYPSAPEPPPRVDKRPCYAIDVSEPIFATLRDDYGNFDRWFTESCQRGQREAFVVDGEDGLAAICILKDEDDDEYGLPPKRLKLCTFKVNEAQRRQRLGPLLLKAALDNAVRRRLSGLYVTAYDKHTELIALFADHGFEVLPEVTGDGELVMWRSLVPPPEAVAELSPFEFNRHYGPRLLNADVPIHLVPIKPQWEERLFPEGTVQLGLFADNAACGNGLRKAYLSRASTQQLTGGDLLLFYRSQTQVIRFVCVVEGTLRTNDYLRLASFVGTRTVYSAREIEEMTVSGRKEAMAILMRQARFLEPGWNLSELKAQGVTTAPPQSIQRVKEKGAEWVRTMLSA